MVQRKAASQGWLPRRSRVCIGGSFGQSLSPTGQLQYDNTIQLAECRMASSGDL